MGLNMQALKMLYREHLYKPINGNELLIGKSTIGISGENLNSFFIENGIALHTDNFINFNEKTKRSSDIFNIDDSFTRTNFSYQSMTTMEATSEYTLSEAQCL